MRKFLVGAACLASVCLTPALAAEQGTRPGLDLSILHAQVVLDRLGFSPGILDGRTGRSLAAALKGFQGTRGLAETGELDPATRRALDAYRTIQPVRRLALTKRGLTGPFFPNLPDKPEAQARLPALGYRGPMEKLAEMFHTTPEVLRELNPPETPLRPAPCSPSPIRFRLARLSRDLDPAWRETLHSLNVDARQPQAARIEVDRSERVLRVFDAGGRLVALFSATMGSSHDPLPIGSWKIQGKAYNPEFHYNPELFWDVRDSKPKLRLPPAPTGRSASCGST